LPRTTAETIAFIIADYAAMKARKKGEWYLLEPGDPLYEDYEPFDSIEGDGPEQTNFLQYFTPEGELIHPGPAWSEVKPRGLSADRLRHFRSTPNELLIGRDGTLIVSAGRWGRRPKAEGGYEYLPIEQYRAWRKEQMLGEPRTVENRPPWAEKVEAIAAWGCVEYSCTRGRFTYTQRLENDGEMREPYSHSEPSFKDADDLREIARDALALAEALEKPTRVIRRLSEVNDRLRDLES
jgi:hypothetical protein